jgi:outer membrane protein OmpA-like peptidoglycan-associated protein
MNKPRNIRPTMLLLALIAATGTALAGDVMLYRQGEKPSPQDVARMLRGEQAQSADEEEIAMPIRTRGIKLLPDVQEPEAKAPRKEIERIARDPAPRQGAGEPTSFALQVQFPFNSAEIQPDMLEPLDAVAEGIRLAGRQIGIVIEGHTDASGSAEYNLQLSRRRAEAVKNYLVLRHGLPAGSFRVVGKGKYDPLVRDNPFAPENRRVQFRAGV